ncbi:helix-turn-helix domain-containing protein [Planococcus sp. APC 4015]|nr:helix-turn-helix domain-containing protein [Planococcus sp. APC 4015]
MPHTPTSEVRLLSPAQTAEILGASVDDVMGLVHAGQLRGIRVGIPARWRIDEASIAEYLDAQAEIARRSALWQQSQEASFPELWGTGRVSHGD